VARPRRALLGVLLVWLAAYFLYTPPSTDDAHGDGSYHPILDRGDGHYMYLMTLSLVLDRDLDLNNQFKLAGDPFFTAGHRMPTGFHWIYPVGTSVLQIPFFLLAQGAAAGADLLGAHIPLHGYTYFHQRITFLGNLLAGFLALVFGYRLARRHVSETAALYGTVAVGLGTAIYFYSVYWVSYSHAWTALACALLLDTWDATRGRHDARRWAVLGALVGLAILTREQEAVFALPLVVEGLVEMVRRVRGRDLGGAARLAGHGVLAVACALVVASPQLIAKQLILGDAFAPGAGPNYMRWSAPFFWETLYATKNGLFVWTPLAYLGALGLAAGRPGGARALGLTLLLVFAAATWVNGSAWAYWSDWGFSNRRFVDCTPLFIVGIAFAVERLRALNARWPRLAPNLALVLALVPLVALNLELSRAMTRSEVRPNAPIRASELYGGSVRRLLERLEGAGGPFTWPYSWAWALRNRVGPARFDTTVGNELLYSDPARYRRPGTVERAALKLVGPSFGEYGVGVPGVVEGKTIWARDGARLLVPLFLAEDVHIELRARVAVPTTVLVNGVARRLDPGPEAVLRVDGPLRIGANSLAFACTPEAQPGCLAVAELTMVYEVPK
jgi:hypothetical protein